MSPLEMAQICARIALDKRATDLLILEVGPVASIADYFVLASGRNRRQLKAISNEIRVQLKEQGIPPLHSEGLGSDHWVLLDYGAVVVHLFDPEIRAFYDLESLWADASRIPVDESQPMRSSRAGSDSDAT